MISAINRLRAKKGFTLIEAIVVIAIIGVLTAMILPTLAYSNKPSVGKGMAKDLFYKAQDVFTSSKIAFPDAVSSGSNVIYFVEIDRNGKATSSGTMTKSIGAPDINGVVSVSMTMTYFPAVITLTSTSTDKDKMDDKIKTALETYTEYDTDMAGTMYVVCDDHYRCRVAYWTDAGHDFSNGGGNFTDNCLLGNGYYCCSFPVAYCDPGKTIFPTFS